MPAEQSTRSSVRRLIAVVLAVVLAAAAGAAGAAAMTAQAFLDAIAPSPPLQAFLDRVIAEQLAGDAALRRSKLGVALIDLAIDGPPGLAQYNGEVPIYPASVVKFVYLMAAYRWQEQGRSAIDAELDAQLTHMIRQSSNQATQYVFARLTGTTPGPELDPAAYQAFRDRRLAINEWLRTLGIADLHCANPTYDGGGDLFGRDAQFLRDRSVGGALPAHGDQFSNRNAMTAVGTAKLLALLATDRAMSPADSATVRQRMRRDPKEQPHLAHRIAGGAARIGGLEVYAKSGTWGPIYADAGIVRDTASGRQFVVAVFTESSPPYRGDFIAELAQRAAQHLLASGTP
jgi:beta-lactamase class A